ncbi:TetR family transcriptional regulator [Caldovatus sediminis]|uniref:TetR family transcriptional regulator n=1 Tax=Caldovatus sediminis TaxID=2041189 RepID=A0A8J2Z7T0_9PROT|nr:TetR family transcriptional regulator [Caldovatus sediminis]GGG17596.1 TetR family transcriptional regulator [Caldovatus sediminis]
MDKMSGAPVQSDPRANQKERTRAALVAAAAELLRRGAPPTVAEAAEAARVSRATAYRYFPTQEALLLEVAELAPAVAPVEATLAALPEGDPEARLLRLLDAFVPVLLAEQVPMRSALRVYLDNWLASRRAGEEAPPLREGRRRRWLDTALEPLRRELPERDWLRLRAALSLTLGIEAVVVMKDVCRIEDDEEVLEVLRWAARALLRAGIEEARPRPVARADGTRRRRARVGSTGESESFTGQPTVWNAPRVG